MAFINSGLARAGLAEQADLATPATQPAIVQGLRGGHVFSLSVEQEADDSTSGTRVAPGVIRTGAEVGFDVEGRALVHAIGYWLKAAMGAVATSGSAPAFTHVFTLADALAYWTAFGEYGGSRYTVRGCKLSELEISWDGTNPLEVTANGTGVEPIFDGAAWDGSATDDSQARYFAPVGGEFKLAGAGGALAVARVNAGSLHITNNVNPVPISSQLLPADQAEGRAEIEWGLTVIPEDMELFREIATGSPTGTLIGACPNYGAVSMKFVDVCDETVSLTLEGPKIAWTAEFPEADPEGAPAELELTGLGVQPASGSAVTATLENDHASYAA